MTGDTLTAIIAFGWIYFGSVMLALAAFDNLADAFWWPIHLAKALTKSLLRALFTGWRL
jgi:hypothetical protein